MFDVGFWELAIIGVVGLIVLGPERLPRAARTTAMWIKKARHIVTDMKSEIEREMDMEEMKKVVGKDAVNSLDEFKKEVKESIDIKKEDLEVDLDMDDPAGLKSLKGTETVKTAPQQAKSENDK